MLGVFRFTWQSRAGPSARCRWTGPCTAGQSRDGGVSCRWTNLKTWLKKGDRGARPLTFTPAGARLAQKNRYSRNGKWVPAHSSAGRPRALQSLERPSTVRAPQLGRGRPCRWRASAFREREHRVPGGWQARITAEPARSSGSAASAVTLGRAPNLSVREVFPSQSAGNAGREMLPGKLSGL